MPGGVNPPMEVVLAWPQPNYANPVTHGKGVVVMEGALLALCYIIVALRVYTRAFQARNFGIDDALIVFNLVGTSHPCLITVLIGLDSGTIDWAFSLPNSRYTIA
jgi:hypothetical protein